jgi:RimJ/RimL family protein N-acetyltransferase
MYISKKFRGQRFGEKQIEEAIDKVKRTNIKGIKTRTWGENKASRKIFENLNFKLVEEKPNTRINGDSTVKYYLELT